MSDQNEEILGLLQQAKPGENNNEKFLEELIRRVNHLINTDFEKLVQLLYRVDVSESKLKKILQENAGDDAGKLIALLLIERQQEKLASRKQPPADIDPEHEAW
jgi:hypothetical protein